MFGLCQRQQHVKKKSSLNRVMYTTYIRIMSTTAKCLVTKYKVQSTKYRETVKTIKISISNTQLILNRVMYTTYLYRDYVNYSKMLSYKVQSSKYR